MPLNSPDLNPIENVWGIIKGGATKGKYYSPDTLLEGWTLRLDGWTLGLDGWTLGLDGWTLGLEGWTLAFDGWTPYLKDGHPTWRTVTLFDGWIFYFHELFICLIFSLLKELPAFSDLYSFYCLTIIIYSFLKTKETTL